MMALPPPGYGSPIDFGRSKPENRRHIANPWIWGAWGGIGFAVIATIASFAGQLHGSQTVWGFGMGGLFWFGICADIWNWLGRRKP